jgi:hypothetical protein
LFEELVHKKEQKMIRSHSFRGRFARLVLVTAVAVLGLYGIIATDGNTNTRKPYALVFVDTDWRLRIRWSDDGINWEEATGANPYVDWTSGIAADDRGALYVVVFADAVLDARFMTGLGPANWDSHSFLVGDGHHADICSATSVAHVSELNWLVAYENDDRMAQVKEFNSSSTVKDFGNDVTPVVGVINGDLHGRPRIVNRNGQLLMSWLTNSKQLQMVTGNIVSGAPVWNNGYIFNKPEPGFRDAPEYAFDLAADGQCFYLAIVRQRDPQPDEQLKYFSFFIYTSTDRLHWTPLTSREIMIPDNLSIAARATNDIVAIVTAPLFNRPMRFDGTSWADLDVNAVFGSPLNNAGFPLTLYAKY